MLKNYITTALRNLMRNKLYSAINIGGLAIALAVYLLANVIVDYERSHDLFFADAERIFAVSAEFQPGSDVGVNATSAVPMVMGPLLREQMPEAELIGRMYTNEVITRSGDKKFYQDMRFVDPEFLEIFSFDFVRGSAETALADPSGVIITETVAEKYFADENPMGQVFTVGAGNDLKVTAVISEPPKNSHFMTNLFTDSTLGMIAQIGAMEATTGRDPAGSWGDISLGNVTYVKLRDGGSAATANGQLADFYENHTPEGNKELLGRFYLTPLSGMNTFVWEMTGLPMLTGIQVLAVLVLLVACLNYINLATAQVVGRTREVGLRKSMGASRQQLFAQFIVESITVATLSLLVAAAVVDILIPIINDASGKNISFSYVREPGNILHMVLLVLTVGLFSGGYPAFLIARAKSISMLNGQITKGRRGAWMRSSMLVVQFTISVFMMGAVGVIYLQNEKIKDSSEVFAKDRIVVLNGLNQEGVGDVRDTLRTEIARLDGVEALTFGNQAPFNMSTSQRSIAKQSGDDAGAITTRMLNIDDGFLATYEIPLLAGRNISRDITNDNYERNEEGGPARLVVNILVNELALSQFDMGETSGAPGQSLYVVRDDEASIELRIVGVIPDVNFLGFHNKLKPYIYEMDSERHQIAAVKISGGQIPETVAAIEEVWDRILPDYPMQMNFLEENFDSVFKIFSSINVALTTFAVIALILAGIGLFGLSAFMAERRTKEIGIRKVMGASVSAIVKLLIWQFSRPVIIAIALGLPLAWFASGAYLGFFSDRIALSPLLFATVGVTAFAFAAITVGGHAIRVARANPINALRWE